MNVNHFSGIILLLVGAMVLYFIYTAFQGVGEQVRALLAGPLAEPITWYLVIGIAAAMGGAIALTLRRRSRSAGRLEFERKIRP